MKVMPLMKTSVPGYECKRGKVRDIYDLGDDQLFIIATDRISAFDVVMANGIPYKGNILTQLTEFWLKESPIRRCLHHLITTDSQFFPNGFNRPLFANRSMLCVKARVLSIECVVRGYLDGSSWKDYCENGGRVCGIQLPLGLKRCQKLAEPIFTPATKARTGHDENITFNQMCQLVGGPRTANHLRDLSLDVYSKAYQFAFEHGIILADTKFEFGFMSDQKIMLIDEVLTPDSSRFWPLDKYQPGKSQPSFDKQYVRDYLEESGWDRNPPGPDLPEAVVSSTQAKYIEIFRRLTGRQFS